MATLKAGGRISTAIALTLQADNVALEVGDPVHITTTYKCIKATGAKPVVGVVRVANKKHGSTGSYPANDLNGDVTADALGFGVATMKSGAALTAGVRVGIGAAGTVVVAGAGVAAIGVCLNSTAAANEDVDVLLQGAPGAVGS